MKNGDENRRSFRIVESVFLNYETISDLDFHQGIEHWKMAQGTGVGVRSRLMDIESRFDQKIFVLKSESLALAECMMLLNEKISLLMEELPGLKANKVALAKQPPQICELGADGMLFASAKNYPADTKLALRFLLASDNRYVETFCRVVRSDDPPGDDESLPYGIAVEFLGMKQEQKDILIQHLFDRESETLRMRRLKLDADLLAQQSD
ncbi:MAG: PilZ domain-containing protein [Woeseiaceae bacterium]